MAISYVSESHTNSGTQYATSVVVSRPASYASGDLFIAVVGGTRTGSVPSGWTQLGTTTCGSSTGTVYVYYKVAGGSEPSTYTFDTTGGTGGARLAFGSILCYRGADTSTPIDTTNFNLATDTGTDFTTASVTANGHQWAVSFAVVYRGSSGNATITASSATQRGSTFGVSSGSENTSYAAFDSNADVASGSVSRTQTVTSAAAGCRGIFLINEGGVSADLGSDGVAHATTAAQQPTILIQTVQSAAATTAAHNTSVGLEAGADVADDSTAVAHDALRPMLPPGAQAADVDAEVASVHLDVNSHLSSADATAHDASGYYGAAVVRVYVVPDENRTFKVQR